MPGSAMRKFADIDRHLLKIEGLFTKQRLNLTYNKINLTYEDLKDFHRPNFAKWLHREKKKRNFSFMISDKFNI